MLEWLKRHAWKACIRQKRIRGSNPRLSALVEKDFEISKYRNAEISECRNIGISRYRNAEISKYRNIEISNN